MSQRILLTHSVNLDISATIFWIKEESSAEGMMMIKAVEVQAGDASVTRKKARKVGMVQDYCSNSEDEFNRNTSSAATTAKTMNERKYILSNVQARPFISAKLGCSIG